MRTSHLIKVCFLLIIFFMFTACDDSKTDDGEKGEPGPAGEVAETDETSEVALSERKVFDADDNELGILLFDEWPGYVIQFSDDSFGMFKRLDGEYFNSLCVSGHCSKSGPKDFGFCFFRSEDCSGNCWVNGKTVKNSIYLAGPDTFVLGGESDPVVTTYLIAHSYYNFTSSACVTSITSVGKYKSSYEVTSEYSFPNGISYPFKAPLKVK